MANSCEELLAIHNLAQTVGSIMSKQHDSYWLGCSDTIFDTMECSDNSSIWNYTSMHKTSVGYWRKFFEKNNFEHALLQM